MASEDGKKKMEKKIKEEVKKEVKKEEKKEKQNKPKGKNKNFKKYIKKEVKKEERKNGENGPKSKFSVRVTATIGYIDGSKDHGPNLKMATFLHPALCKGPDEDKAFGPLQAAAAQYGLWRLRKVTVRMTPLVGSSAVSGTVTRLSANLTQTPGSTSWGGLGARKHRDFHAGKAGSFILTHRDVAGPRAGGWWVTDTNTEGAQSAGPVLEAHSLGKTSSTYQDKVWLDQLFIVEMSGRWEFANYNNNPALGALEKHEATVQNVKITTDANGEMQLEMPSTSTAARFMNDPTAPRAGETNTPGEIVYQIVDTAAGLAGTALPPPFNWLVKGGWWFCKKLIGRNANAATDTFKIYASLSDAQNNKPAISSTKSFQGAATTTEFQITQMNSPNMGGASANPSYPAGVKPDPHFPVKPVSKPNGHFKAVLYLKSVWHYAPAENLSYPALITKASVQAPNNTTWFPAMTWRVTASHFFDVQNSDLIGWWNPPDPFMEVLLKEEAVQQDSPLKMKILGIQSTWIGTDVNSTKYYMHILLWNNKEAGTTFATLDSTDCANLYRPAGQNTYRFEKTTANCQVLEPSIYDGMFLTVFLTKNGPNLDNIAGATITGYPFGVTPSGEPLLLMGIFAERVNPNNVTQVILQLETRQKKLTKLEKLASKLGIDLEDLSSSSDECETADESDSDDDFENVTETALTDRVEKLMQAGFSLEEATKMAKV
nr:MAG: ORF2 [Bat astrovirus]